MSVTHSTPEEGSGLTTLPTRASGELASAGGSAYREHRFLRYDLVGELRRSLRWALGVALVLALLASGLAVGLYVYAQRSKLIPYVVEVDRHGAAVAFGPAEELEAPDRRMLLHAISLWVRSARTITRDRPALRERLERAYAYTGGRAVELLSDWYRRHPPFARAEHETVSVAEIDSILATGEVRPGQGPRSFRVQWTEAIYDPGGHLEETQTWQALVELEVDPPEEIEEVLDNPLGIRVVDFDWQRLETSP